MNKVNRTKHGVWFEEAQSFFHDPHARLFYDPEHSEGEDRFILLGVSSAQERWSSFTATGAPIS